MAFREVVRNPVYLQVAEQLREAILAGELTQGDPLPTERELSESFGVSRASVREALRALEAQGLITAGGAPVRAVVAGAVDGPASNALVNLLRLNAVSLRDLVDFRCTLEAAALRLVAAEGEPGRLEEARRALGEMRADDISVEAFDDADVRFHVALVRASGNEAMHLVMLALRNAVARHLLGALRSQRDGRATLGRLAGEHEAILAAVEAGDGERAAELVTDHIRGFYKDYVRVPDGDATAA